MRMISGSAMAGAIVMLMSPGVRAQAQTPTQAQEGAIAVTAGGISVPGWTGKIDASEEKAGRTASGNHTGAEVPA